MDFAAAFGTCFHARQLHLHTQRSLVINALVAGELPPDLKAMMEQISVIAAAPDKESRDKQYEALAAMLCKSEATSALPEKLEKVIVRFLVSSPPLIHNHHMYALQVSLESEKS
jgi:hypothetical protein